MPVKFIDWDKEPANSSGKKLLSKSFSCDPEMYKRLRRVALRRAEIKGDGQPSVSRLLQLAIEFYIDRWEEKWPPRSKS